jgi:D-amino-acid dehydrogenase
VVLCTGAAAGELLAPAGIRLPLVPVWGLSVTAPVNHVDGQLPHAPRAAVIDERHQVTISRLGQRVRVAGGHRIGGSSEALPMRHLRALYRVLDEWFPGSAVIREAQHWAGARPMLPDGAPLLGASGLPGVWLNLGHGGHGWALACGVVLYSGVLEPAPAGWAWVLGQAAIGVALGDLQCAGLWRSRASLAGSMTAL